GCKLVPPKARIERHPHQARRHGGVIRFEIFADVREKESDALALAQPKAKERIGKLYNARMHGRIRPCAGGIDEGWTLAMDARELTPLRGDVQLPRGGHAHQPLSTTRPLTARSSIRAWPSAACGKGRMRPMRGLTAPVARRCKAVRTSAKVAFPEPAMRMRRMMTRPGSSSTGLAPRFPSTTTVALGADERRLSWKVPVTTFSS